MECGLRDIAGPPIAAKSSFRSAAWEQGSAIATAVFNAVPLGSSPMQIRITGPMLRRTRATGGASDAEDRAFLIGDADGGGSSPTWEIAYGAECKVMKNATRASALGD